MTKNIKELDLIYDKIKDIYGRIPLEVERLLQKKKINLLLEEESFEEMNEYKDCVDIYLSYEFSSINGIGIKLFQTLTKYLSYIKVTFIKKELKIRFNKKGEWINILIDIMLRIVELHNSLK